MVTWIVLGAFLAVGVGAAGGIWWWLKRGKAPAPEAAPSTPPPIAPAPPSLAPQQPEIAEPRPPAPAPGAIPAETPPYAPLQATPPAFDAPAAPEVAPPPAAAPPGPPSGIAGADAVNVPRAQPERDAKAKADETRRRAIEAEKQAARKAAERQRQSAAPYDPPPAPAYQYEPRYSTPPTRRTVQQICSRFDDPARREKCHWRQCGMPERENEAFCRQLYGAGR